MTDERIAAALEALTQQVVEARADIRTLTQMVRDLADAQLEDHEEIRRVKETVHPPPPSNGAAE